MNRTSVCNKKLWWYLPFSTEQTSHMTCFQCVCVCWTHITAPSIYRMWQCSSYTYISWAACQPTWFYRCIFWHHFAQHNHQAATRQGGERLDWAVEQQPVAPHQVCCSNSHPGTDLSWALHGNTIVVPVPAHFHKKKSLSPYPLPLREPSHKFLVLKIVQLLMQERQVLFIKSLSDKKWVQQIMSLYT